MTDLLTSLAQLLLGFALGLLYGLYHGERARRVASESYLVHGTPSAPQARVLEGPPDPEARIAELGFDPSTIERGARDIMAQARKLGRTIDYESAKQQAAQMLHLEFDPDTSKIPAPPL